MAHFTKPAEGSWTEHYPELGTAPVSYADSITPEYYERERDAIFARTWLNVGRVEQLSRKGSYFTRELHCARTSIIVVRGMDDEVRAFHNICRHRGNKLVWSDFPQEETSGVCRQFTCKYHGWRYDLEGELNFVQQESEFFDLDKSEYPLASVQCEVWAGFIFVNLDPDNATSVRDYLGDLGAGIEAYPFHELTQVHRYRAEIGAQLEAVHRRLHRVLPRTRPAREASGERGVGEAAGVRLRGTRLRHRRPARHGVVVGRHVAAQGPQHGEADRARGCAAACSARGTRPTSASTSCRPASTRRDTRRGGRTRSCSSPTS